MNYKTINTQENIPEILYVFQLYSNSPLGRSYNDYYLSTKEIKSAGISNLFCSEKKALFENGDIVYNNILDDKFSVLLSKFGYENLNNEFEYCLEQYRKENFKNYPSRLSSIYAFGDLETCRLVSSIYRWNMNEIKTFKVKELYSACKVHMEIVSILKDNFQSISNIEYYYEKYWRGEKIDDIHLNNTKISVAPIYEYLIEGVLEEIGE